jgi:hypothetical protein
MGGGVVGGVGHEKDGLHIVRRMVRVREWSGIIIAIIAIIAIIMIHPALVALLPSCNNHQYIGAMTESRGCGGVGQGRERHVQPLNARCGDRQGRSADAAAHGGARGSGVGDCGGKGGWSYLDT